MCQCQQLKPLVFQLCMMAILYSAKHCHALNRGCVFDAFCAYLLTVVSDGQKTFAFVLFLIPTLLYGLNVLNHHTSLDLGVFCKCISGLCVFMLGCCCCCCSCSQINSSMLWLEHQRL